MSEGAKCSTGYCRLGGCTVQPGLLGIGEGGNYLHWVVRKAFLLTHPLLRGLKEVRWEVVR